MAVEPADDLLPAPEPRGDAALTDALLDPMWRPPGAWAWLLLLSSGGVALLGLLIAYTVASGIGVWGNNIPVAWAFGIINFVWWIGLGHAGTFISAFLLLLEQPWRGSINRIAEAMTLFAVMNAGLFPLLHLGRPWFFYWLLPYPATMGVWPQFRSALPWDVAAVSTYFIVSLLFWYVGLVPDLASARDRAPTRARARIYGLLALGWRGAGRDWSRYRIAYGLLAGLATPLVISVHSVVSFDFAISQLPGWHSTIMPPFFVIGAIFSGFALVLLLVIPIRRVYRLERIITAQHLDALAKVLLATGSLMLYCYAVETFIGWYSAADAERAIYLDYRPTGPYAGVYWAMVGCNALVPQLLWVPRLRRSQLALVAISLLVMFGMWAERFIIIVTSLAHDFLPSSWGVYLPTWVDLGIFAGTLGFFSFLFLLFVRWLPMIPIHEVKKLQHDLEHGR